MYENPDQYPDYFVVLHFNGLSVTRFFIMVMLAGAGPGMRYPDYLNGPNPVLSIIGLRLNFLLNSCV